jgi:hypothetical protein
MTSIKPRIMMGAFASLVLLLSPFGVRAIASAAAVGTTIAPGAANVSCATPTVTTSDATVKQDVSAAAPGTVLLVHDVTQLQTALNGAVPGLTIDLADGTYSSAFTIPAGVSGQQGSPITICGSQNAVINGGGKSHVFYLAGTKLSSNNVETLVAPVNYWTLEGFTITNGNKGLDLAYASYSQIIGVTIHDTSGAGIHVESFSSHNDFEGDLVYNAGGEAIYNGSAVSNWGYYSQGQPDASNFNKYNGLVLYCFAADGFDVKEGTVGTLVENNTMDGGCQTKAKGWVDVKGNYALVAGNNGSSAYQDGFGNHIVVKGDGLYNTFELNSGAVNASGYAFRVDAGSIGTTVDAGQQVTGGTAGYSNWATITPRYATVGDAYSAWLQMLQQNGLSFN